VAAFAVADGFRHKLDVTHLIEAEPRTMKLKILCAACREDASSDFPAYAPELIVLG
jgi:hypothetical protein